MKNRFRGGAPYFIALVVLMTACTRLATTIPPTATLPRQLSPSLLPTMIAPTPMLPTLTPSALPTHLPAPTPTPAIEIPQPCSVKVDRSNLEVHNTIIPGSLIFSNQIMGGDPTTIYPLFSSDPGPFITYLGLSPNGHWLAYSSFPPSVGYTETLHLLSAEGQELTITPTESDVLPLRTDTHQIVWRFGSWVSNEQLWVHLIDGRPHEQASLDVKPVLFNPFTGIWEQAMVYDLPNRSLPDSIAFSPDLQRVFYIADNSSDYNLEIDVVMWDVIRRQVLWQDNRTSTFELGMNGEAAWSNDGAQIAFSMGETVPSYDSLYEGVYLLDRDGQNLHLITDFRSTYKGQIVLTQYLAWSPNNRYLAFVTEHFVESRPEEPINEIYLFDTLTNQLINLCPFRDSGNGIGNTSGALVWSPDSRALIYACALPIPNTSNAVCPLTVVDIYSGEVVSLSEKTESVIGWSPFWPFFADAPK